MNSLIVDSVISVIVKTAFVLMLLFDVKKEKYVGQKYSPKNKYFFASFKNDRGLSLDDKTKDYIDRNAEVKYIRYTRSHNLVYIYCKNFHI